MSVGGITPCRRFFLDKLQHYMVINFWKKKLRTMDLSRMKKRIRDG